jgi:membrane protein DedA with SNARE-associated domain
VSWITDALTGAIGDAGVYAVFALMFVDAILPAGSEIVMLYAGAVAAGAFPESQVTFFGVEIESTAWGYVVMSLAGALGYWLGSLLGWAIGFYGGHPLVVRYGRFFHLDKEKVDRAEVWFDRRGDAAVFWARNLPVARSFISIPAGVFEMRFGPYAFYSLLGSLPWAFGFAAAGVALGEGWERVHDRFRWVDYAVVGLIVLGIAYLVWRAVRRRQASRAAAGEETV